MRMIGTKAMGVRLPIISPGDDLVDIVAQNVIEACESIDIKLSDNDVIGVTETIVAKAYNNFASIDHIKKDIENKFPEGEVGVVFPILSRNRFSNILKGISKGSKKVFLLLKYPCDEVGNPVMDIDMMDEASDTLKKGLLSENEFRSIVRDYVHPFTKIDYVSYYKSLGDNIEVYFSDDPRDILKLTGFVIDAEIHERFRTKKRLMKAGAQQVVLLSDSLADSVCGSGFNPEYGVLGSNLASEDKIKLFPRDCDVFVNKVQSLIKEKAGVLVNVMVYGDGAFKDPFCGIWELADPVVSPGFTDGLHGTPNEIKLKYVADNDFGHLPGSEKREAITEFIKAKNNKENVYSEGTTPRKYSDLLGSLCDLMSGSGDKGTPVVLIQGYFDDYSID